MREGDRSFKDQLRNTAGQTSQVPERADASARALFALKFADRWLAEQVEEESVAMRGGQDRLRRTYTLTGQSVEIVLEQGVDRRLIGAVEPPNSGWVLVRAGTFRDLIRIDDAGMFSTVVPMESGPIDLVLEFDDDTTMTMKSIGD